jgi:hypothetical protein
MEDPIVNAMPVEDEYPLAHEDRLAADRRTFK